VLGVENAGPVDVSVADADMVANASVCSFATAMEIMFGSDVTTEDVRNFIARIRGPWVKPEALNPVLAERIILSGLGEEGLLDGVPRADIVSSQNLIAGAVLRERGIGGAQLEEFLDEVVELMNEPIESGEQP